MDKKGITQLNVAIWIIVIACVAGVAVIAYDRLEARLFPTPAKYTASFDHAYINVTDALTDDPIGGATVKLTGEVIQSKTTNSDGVADFVGLPAGTYKVTIENTTYYSLVRTGQLFQEVAPKATTAKTYSITRFGTYKLDNGDEGFVSASPRTWDNDTASDEEYVEFDLKAWNYTDETLCVGTVLTIEIDELSGDNIGFENIACTSGQSITTVTTGKEYTISLGDLAFNSKTTVTLKIGVSNANVENAQLPITISVNDTPAVDTDVGSVKVSKDFTLNVT